ncbi:Solute carrier family 25 member 36-A [Portunus trituberculatus]|uniref:Solute carrier family 25 member 36-A n=1 Tax=Portunus trituberculatus TaxID=210409 RepID=A0A5B7D8K3_PORTR|nr:Solute carrier family 25 member 36-A [Portunus trituberculatus]
MYTWSGANTSTNQHTLLKRWTNQHQSIRAQFSSQAEMRVDVCGTREVTQFILLRFDKIFSFSNRKDIIDRCGGTMGAVATCPLEVVKTRLQSSSFTYMSGSLPPPAAQQRGSTTCPTVPQHHHHRGGGGLRRLHTTTAFTSGTQIVQLSQQLPNPPGRRQSLSILHCLKYIVEVEGPRALFRGLGPNLVGVAPSRAIYFCSYSQMKKFLNGKLKPDTPVVHVLSASWAGERRFLLFLYESLCEAVRGQP